MTDYRTRLEHAALTLFATGRYATHAAAIREAAIFLSTFDTSHPAPKIRQLGWQPWVPSGKTPVCPGVLVDVILRDNSVLERCESELLRWSHKEDARDILLWRPSK